jgi:hypothetical protein
MRGALVLPLVAAIACSSSTLPQLGPLSGSWQATTASLPTGIKDMRVMLMQANDTLTGSAVVEFIGGRPAVTLQVHGRAGLDGSMACFPVTVMGSCHVTFQFTAADASDDDVFFQGQVNNNGNLLFGDVESSFGLPFGNVDGRALQFSRVMS